MQRNENYYISTGRRGARLTLRVRYEQYYQMAGWMPRDNYVRSLGTDPVRAIEVARALAGDTPLDISGAEARLNAPAKALRGDVFRNGKYKGQQMADVLEEDRGYVLWTLFSAKFKASESFYDTVKQSLTSEERERYFPEPKPELNPEQSWSEGDKIQASGTVISVKVDQSPYGYNSLVVKYTVQAEDGNLFWFQSNAKCFDDVMRGDAVTIKGTVSGIKSPFTYLKRVKTV